ncbi:MAG: hypothetical protein V4665_04405 [Patescibacteria group bacterium]
MKKIIILVFVFLWGLSGTVLAYMGPGSQYDPLHVQIEETPLDRLRTEQQNVQSLKKSLQSQYGTTAYYACYDTTRCADINSDTSFPGATQMCEYQVQSCLGHGTYKSKLTEECRKRHGDTSSWNDTTKKCTAPQKTNDQICNDSFLNSKWDGVRNDKGGLVCGCATGFQWNTSGTQCIAIPNKVVQQNVNIGAAPTCSIVFNPQIIEAGQWVVGSRKTSGTVSDLVMKYVTDATGKITFAMTLDSNDTIIKKLNNGQVDIYKTGKLATQETGKFSQTWTIKGPGGSGTCTGSYTVIPSKTSTKKVSPEKITTTAQVSETIQASFEASVPVSEPVDIPAYQKIGLFRHILNWFK